MKSKEQKRTEAEERQRMHDSMTGFEKLAKLTERPGASSKERSQILGEAS